MRPTAAAHQDGKTALHYAAQEGNRDIAALLLEHDADANAREKTGNTPLHYAAQQDNKNIAALLLQHDANINAADQDGYTALHYAARQDYNNFADFLLKQGAQINAKNKFGVTALEHAATFNSAATAQLLLDRGVDANEADNDGDTALLQAAYRHSIDVIECLVAGPVDIKATNHEGRTVLHCAVTGRGAAFLERLLDLKIHDHVSIHQPDACGWSLLHYTAGVGSLPSTSLLLQQHNASITTPDNHGRTPLHLAVWSGQSMQRSLAYPIRERRQNREQFMANIPNLDESAKSSLQRLWDLQLSTLPNMNRAYFLSAQYFGIKIDEEDNSAAIVTLIYDERHANMNLEDNNGLTPLHWLVRAGTSPDILSMFLNDDASLSQVDHKGLTPLHWWSRASGDEIIGKRLLESTVHLSQRDVDGKTPLHWAAAEGAPTAIKQLLDKGANPTAKDNAGRTPLDLLMGRKQLNETVKAIYDGVPSGQLSSDQERTLDWIIKDLEYCTDIKVLLEGSNEM